MSKFSVSRVPADITLRDQILHGTGTEKIIEFVIAFFHVSQETNVIYTLIQYFQQKHIQMSG